jgi:metal-responsive CopG/Arc/MetJ family transcriptional regulator
LTSRDILDIFTVVTKVLISISEETLRQIDRMAKESGLSRSAYIASIAERDAESARKRTASSRASALKRLDRLFAENPSGDATAAIRAARDAR